MKISILKVKNMHLGLTSLTVIGVGLSYGISPNKVLPFFFDFKVESVDLNNVFRAIMGLYIGLAIYWLIGIFKPEHWWNATLISSIFMGGLAFGRIISILIDGIPSAPFSIGSALEISYMILGVFNLTTQKFLIFNS
ncbi:MAG TPA: DUF4345 domain-containing protein [Flavobacterium sp.]|nr:DUF4345 domain-containing protein [Flavobacterium sp.]HAT77737.1 DUF4345 domain-containing protein [Flavobacterium sp.]HAT80743.1 DUF4345 domain-containing protein [Flavobacterium sp.]